MKKLFGALLGATALLSLASCDKEKTLTCEDSETNETAVLVFDKDGNLKSYKETVDGEEYVYSEQEIDLANAMVAFLEDGKTLLDMYEEQLEDESSTVSCKIS